LEIKIYKDRIPLRVVFSLLIGTHDAVFHVQVLRDMVASSVYVVTTMYAFFLLVIFYVLYDEMAISFLYGIHQVQLTTYVWFSLVRGKHLHRGFTQLD
jgi:hypothetical protein